MSGVSLKHLSKSFDATKAVQGLNFDIKDGEFFSLLGPSGCGKTTTLRMIAGFEFPTSGRIFFDKRNVTFLKPNRRNTGMVFQNFALFPHMTVFENVAFGLRARRENRFKIKLRVQKALELVDLAGFESRKVTQLSGGQQQRVALARAVVIEPDILLLDEPLSNLDAKLREETREEIRLLQQRLGITTIYVTHDQDEALSLSDRIAVMNQGVCLQVGTPQEIYQSPANSFVADFVGNSNVLQGKIIRRLTKANQVEIASDWLLHVGAEVNGAMPAGETVTLSVRPEHIELLPAARTGRNVFDGLIRRMRFSGAVVDYEIEVRGHLLRAKRLAGPEDFERQTGAPVALRIEPANIHLLPS